MRKNNSDAGLLNVKRDKRLNGLKGGYAMDGGEGKLQLKTMEIRDHKRSTVIYTNGNGQVVFHGFQNSIEKTGNSGKYDNKKTARR